MQDEPVIQADRHVRARCVRDRGRPEALQTPAEVIRENADGRARREYGDVRDRLECNQRRVEFG